MRRVETLGILPPARAAELAEREALVDRLRRLEEVPGWAELQGEMARLLRDAEGTATRNPMDQETPYMRYYNLGVWKGMELIVKLRENLIRARGLSEVERTQLAEARASGRLG